MVRRFMQDIRDRLHYEFQRFMDRPENLRGRDQVTVRVPVDPWRLEELGLPIPDFVRMCRALDWHVERDHFERRLFVIHRVPVRAVPRYRMPAIDFPLNVEPGAVVPLPEPEVEYHYEMDFAAGRDMMRIYVDGDWNLHREPVSLAESPVAPGFTMVAQEDGTCKAVDCWEEETLVDIETILREDEDPEFLRGKHEQT